ncbi:MAG: membrane protein insertion efficiency factor YidD [Candidatus Moranbacteria bacterium]|jgi:putative membrane protein insertion efficiency factor|nr:membrane protein insertion efficiency factor YidD [Candidatus Moranbacteria bacterium]MDD5651791.1 membrane protein insertion efficiency factor YidD [Candidatus Moranbacteria bacterium]MDX9855798.1 membrane protein insertion efficiency factor YidD [Candidatus Moranbacteria bacterium]
MKKFLLFLIRLYQKFLSPDQGIFSFIFSERFCRFHPTCSEYTYQAVERFGILKGGFLGFKRVIRCHPWNEGGYDPIPPKHKS